MSPTRKPAPKKASAKKKTAAKKPAHAGPGMEELKFTIDSAWERRAMLTPDEIEGSTRPMVERVLDGLERGEFRVAEPDGKGGWTVNEWLKKAVLLYFRTQPMQLVEAEPAPFWDKVPARFAGFDEAKFPYGLRVTVTRDQIAALPDSIEFICANFKTESIQVEPAYQLGRWTTAPSAETDEFIAAYREAQAHAQTHGRAISYSAARVGLLTNHFCGVSQDTFALSPDGNVSSCYEVFAEDNPWAQVFFYGAPEQEAGKYRFNLPVLNNLRGLAVQHREFCQGCFAKWSCAGDCYHKALTISGTEEFQGSDRCHITRELTKDQILEKIAASGGLFWHEGNGATVP
mgnify:CR=1 FL=1